MENCNLLLLCNTSDAESEAIRKHNHEQKGDISEVKIKQEVNDDNTDYAISESNKTSTPQPVAEAVAESMSVVVDKWATSQISCEENCNNNRLSVGDTEAEAIDHLNSSVITSSESPSKKLGSADGNSLTRNEGTHLSADGTDDSNSLIISINGNDKSSDRSISGSSFDVDTSPDKVSNLESEHSHSSNECLKHAANHVADESVGHNSGKQDAPTSSISKTIPEGDTKDGLSTPQSATEESHISNPLSNTKCGSEVDGMNESCQNDERLHHSQMTEGIIPVNELVRKPPSEHNTPVSVPQQPNGMQHQVPAYIQIDGNYVYDSVPGMDTLAETAMSQQMSLMQQQSLEHGHFNLPQGWNHSVTDASFGCPLASSTPEVDGRRFTFLTQDGQTQDGTSFIQAYQSLPADNQAWQVQGKQGYPDQEQLRWMTNNMTTGPHNQHGVMTYDQIPVASERNWDATAEAVRSIQNDPHASSQVYVYPPQQTAPLDMSPAAELIPPEHQANMIQPRRAVSSEMVRETARPIKRSHSSCSMDLSNDGFPQETKVPKGIPENESSTGENYQISTNVHTLKPRHMVSWYIDHLIQENENVTQISKSYTIPVNIFNSKDMYFMEAVLKKVNFPSPKFLKWMHGNFPNINISAIDFSEGKRPYYTIPYEEQLQGKQKNDIIKDIFFYFQQRKMN